MRRSARNLAVLVVAGLIVIGPALGSFNEWVANGVAFTGREEAWIAGDSGLWKTDSGGSSWVRLNKSLRPFFDDDRVFLRDVTFVDERHALIIKGFITGTAILATDDVDGPWEDRTSALSEAISGFNNPSLRFFRASDDGTVWLVAMAYEPRAADDLGPLRSRDFLLKSSDYGESWQVVLDVAGSIRDVTVELPGQVSLLTSDDSGIHLVISSFDGGRTWPLVLESGLRSRLASVRQEEWLTYGIRPGVQRIASDQTNPPNLSLTNSRSSDHSLVGSTVWTLGTRVDSGFNSSKPLEFVVNKSLDQGRSWTEVLEIPPTRRASRGHIRFVDAEYGWVVLYGGFNFQVFRTVDGGESWSQVFTFDE